MDYINEQDFLDRYPIFKDMSKEIEIAIIDSKSIIDSYLMNRFELKGLCQIPLLKRIASDLTCYFLQIRNLQAKDNDEVTALYDHAIKMLNQIKNGELSLDLNENKNDTGSAVILIGNVGDYEYR